MQMLENLARRVEGLRGLDPTAERVASAVAAVTHRPGVVDALSGTPLGHPLHPVLTDLPIGSWTSAFFLDLMGGRSSRRAAQLLVGLGVVSAVPTAMTGLADWADTVGGTRRLGVAHAAINSSALLLYAMSWGSRRRGHHGRGVVLGMLGATAATAAAYLGGHLVYRTGTGVDVNAARSDPADWTKAESASTVQDGAARCLTVDGTEVLATMRDGQWSGIGAKCSHRGGPLQDGAIEGGCVTCPWHASRFDLADGSVLAGPATAPQPRYEVREHDGSFELRRLPPSAGGSPTGP
jgi:nitrite reductase/ring-hydroxylating ferredoxin subunit/uncharacterized membrane protein